MSVDPRRIIVTESRCPSCSVHTVHVHHQNFPELRVEALSAEGPPGTSRTGCGPPWTPSPTRRTTRRSVALADAQAFLDREGYAHPGRDVSGPHQS